MRSGQRLAVVSGLTALAASAAASATVAPEQRPQTGSHVEPPGAAPQAMYAARTTHDRIGRIVAPVMLNGQDRKSTRLNSSHTVISYAVFCLKKKKKTTQAKTYRDSTMTRS